MCTKILSAMKSLFLRRCKRKGKRKDGRNVVIVKLSSLQWIAYTKATVDINWEL
jgi:hypothetical protein